MAQIASLDARPNNLPIQTTSLIGRDGEAASIRALLVQDDLRLLTLTGPGGSGKTRLALHVATDLVDRFEDGVFFVDLSPISDPTLVASTIATVVGVADTGERLLDDLKRFLQHRSLLLVLDNFEQILDAGSLVVELLTSSAYLKILVTSRAPLQVRGEHELDVPPLAVPDSAQPPSAEALQEYPSVSLFVERAQAVRPDFALTPENSAAVAAICSRLDGLPLALELAAARVRLLPPEAMARRLEQRLPLLTGGARDLPARQQALRDTIAWSYDLLEPEEQRAFRALAVFVGGFTLDAAEALLAADGQPVDALDLVSQLVARSLIREADLEHAEPRFRMLETIREFGLDQLEANGETAQARERHLQLCSELAERAMQHATSPDFSRWIDRFEDELDNFRLALGWADQTGDPSAHGLRLAIAGRRIFWTLRGYLREGRGWLDRLLPHAPLRSRIRAATLEAIGYLALREGDYAAAAAPYDEGLAIYRELADKQGIADMLRYRGVVPQYLGDYVTARSMLEEGLAAARDFGSPTYIQQALRNLGDLHRERGDYPAAAASYEESLALARAAQSNHEIAYCLRGLGHLARAQGHYARAEEHLRESLVYLKPLRDRRCTPLSLEGLACITVGAGWAERAARLLGASQALQARTETPSPPSALADYERTVADARKALGTERFEALWADGATMDLEEAVELALSEPRHTEENAEVSTASQALNVPLSPREREVVTLIASGLSNRQIADRLVLSVRTVERHIENVYNRLGISGKAGRAIVTAYALRHGVVAPS